MTDERRPPALILKPRNVGITAALAAMQLQRRLYFIGLDLGMGESYTATTYAGIQRSDAPPILQPVSQDNRETSRKEQQRRYREHLDRKLNKGRRWPKT